MTQKQTAARFAFLRILGLIVDGLSTAGPPPDWSNLESVRDWLRRLSPVVSQIASRAVTTIDEATGSLATAIVTSDDLWAATSDAVAEFLGPGAPGQLSGKKSNAVVIACRKADSNLGSIDSDAVVALAQSVASGIAACRTPHGLVETTASEPQNVEPPNPVASGEQPDEASHPAGLQVESGEPAESQTGSPIPQQDEPPSEVSNETPESYSLSRAGIEGRTAKLLTQAGLTTAGQVASRLKDRGLTEISGIGEEREKDVREILITLGLVESPSVSE